MSKAELKRTVQQLEMLVRQLKLAVQDGEPDNRPAATLCQENISTIPDWP